MLLLKVRDYIQLAGSVTLTDLARHFDTAESAMQDMAEQWVRKGKVLVVKNPSSPCVSGSCGACSQGANSSYGGCNGSQIWYRWRFE